MRPVARLGNAALWLTAVLGVVVIASTVAMVVFHFRAIVVQSQSMEPAYPVRSVTIVRSVPRPDVHVGDVVLADAPGGAHVLYRVHSLNADGTATLKGDANASAKPRQAVLSPSVDRATTSIPHLGQAVAFARSPLAGFALALIVLSPLLLSGGATSARDPQPARA